MRAVLQGQIDMPLTINLSRLRAVTTIAKSKVVDVLPNTRPTISATRHRNE